ncbi:MAG: magnesium transporter [Cyanobacteria bacterium HKST-UBA02]|nr:magnesium transporter [Cyanobacteria bacterium HKST-UBA02]
MPQALQDHLFQPVLQFARTDQPVLHRDAAVEEALDYIRTHDIEDRLVYFYVVDEAKRLVGVVPTRRLLTAGPRVKLGEIMQTHTVSIPDSATVLQACKFFATYKYLAFPVTDRNGTLLGAVDISFFRKEQLSFAHRQQIEDTFQLIGFSLAEVSNKSALVTFRYRFPWLFATIAGGTCCAVLCSQYESTLETMMILAFFLTLVLGLGESVSMQSMTVAIQRLHFVKPSWAVYLSWIRAELLNSLCLGTAAGFVVAGIVAASGDMRAAAVVGSSIAVTIVCACLLGISVPTLLHAIHEDSKIAAGPITLAVTDLLTLMIYLNAAMAAVQMR